MLQVHGDDAGDFRIERLAGTGLCQREAVRVLMGDRIVDDKRAGLGIETHDVAARVIHLRRNEHHHVRQGVGRKGALIRDIGGTDRQGGRERFLAQRSPGIGIGLPVRGEHLLDLAAGLLELRLRAALDGNDRRDAESVHLRALKVVSESLGVLLGLAHGGRHVALVDEVADLGTARVELIGVVFLGDLMQVVLCSGDRGREFPGPDVPGDGEVVGQARQI